MRAAAGAVGHVMEIKVSDVLRDLLLQGPTDTGGICVQVHPVAERMGCDFTQCEVLYDQFYDQKREAILSWPEAVGVSFPVPHPTVSGLLAAERAYWVLPLWGKDTYGNSRRRLLRHLINWYKDRGM